MKLGRPSAAELAESAALLAIVLLWGLHVGYPMQALQNARWTVLGYAVPVYYFFTASAVLGAAAAALAFKRDWSEWELLWWLLPLICLPGILRSADLPWSLRQWLSWMIRGVIPGGVLLLTARRKSPESLLLYWVYPIVIAASLLGLWELYSRHNPLWDRFGYDFKDSVAQTFQPDNPFYRPSAMGSYLPPLGTQGNRIPYAAVLVGFFPFGLWALKHGKRFYWARLLALGALFSIIALARVRAAWIGILTAVVLTWVVAARQDRRALLKLGAVLLMCFSGFLVWPKTRVMLWQRLNSFHLSEESIRIRLDLLGTAAVLKERWLAGVGFGQFPTECKAYYRGARPWIGTADDQVLRWATENGVPSLLLLAAFFLGLIRAGWGKIRRMEDARRADFYRALLVGWASLATTFLFFDGFYWGACNMTFWALLGLFAACLRPAESATRETL